mgnify:CR=1 FL=1
MAEIKQITTEELRHLDGQEGMILQGCGGDLQEWVDGINDLLTEACILLDGSRFESVFVFQHQELTNLLFPFDGVKLDVGKLAMWRLQTYGQFVGTWLSDYVPNQLGGYHLEDPKQRKPSMRLEDQDGNIFSILGRASHLLKEAGQKDRANEMFRRVTSSDSYAEALHIISEYVDTELSSHTPPSKSHQKKKGRSAYER